MKLKTYTYILALLVFSSCGLEQKKQEEQIDYLFAKIEDTLDLENNNIINEFKSMDFQFENASKYELIDFKTSMLGKRDTFPALVFNKKIQIVIDEQNELSGNEKYWTGNLTEVNSLFALYQVDNVYSGAFFIDNTQYEIKNIAGQYLLLEIQQSDFIDEEEPLKIIDDNNEDDDPSSFKDSNEFIDVLVCYSKKARNGAGSTSKIKSEIGLAILETNQAYANSNVNHRVRLTGTYELDYNESGISSIDVDWIRNNTTVQKYRNQVKADVVIFIVESLSSCGRVYAIQENISKSFSPNAYGVVKRNCATGYYSFGHELGHLMGCRHNCEKDKKNTPFNHSHGYSYCGNGPNWRTIMSYRECGNKRIPFWSNPNKLYKGKPMGSSSGSCKSNNASTLNKTSLTVANFKIKNGGPNG